MEKIKIKIFANEIKIRKFWRIKPFTKIKKSEKLYTKKNRWKNKIY